MKCDRFHHQNLSQTSTLFSMVMIMMPKDDAIVLVEAVEIMESLPSQMQHDDQIMDSVIESLQSGVSKLAARQDALEIAQLKLQEAVTHGFSFVNNEIQGIKHGQEIDRIHNNYAQKLLMETKLAAEKALERTQELAIGVVRAEEKAQGAKDLSKQSSRFLGLDPLSGMALCAIGVVLSLGFMSLRVEKTTPQPSSKNLDLLTCGVEVTCIPNQPRQPIPTKDFGGV
jgi:aspartate carbamoyltransferase regulatory subunit